MKQLILTFLFYLVFTSLKAQDNIALKASLGVDGYNISYDDSFFTGGKVGIEMAVLKKMTVGCSVGYNTASSKSAVSYFGLDTRYYFGKQLMQGFYSELGLGYSAFKFKNVPVYKYEQLPKNTLSVLLNAGFQKVTKNNILLGVKLGIGVFGPKGSTDPALRLQGAFEIGYKF